MTNLPRFSSSSPGRLLFAAIVTMLLSAGAVAGDAVADRYPPGSIKSVEVAEQALADVGKERAAVETHFAAEERACYAKFFAASCHEDATEQRRGALEQLRNIENEANLYMRRARVQERDKALAEKRAQDEAEQAKRQADSSAQRSAKVAKQPAAAPDTHGANDTNRVVRHDLKMKQLQAEEAENAQKRAENIAAYQKKVEEAQAHRKEVERRKEEKEQARVNKQNSAPAAQ